MSFQEDATLCDGCDRERAGCVAVGEAVLCAECILRQSSEAQEHVKTLWEAAVHTHRRPDRPLADCLANSIWAFAGRPIVGKDLYKIGEELGFINPGERDEMNQPTEA